ELFEVRGRRIDVGAIGLEQLAQLLRQDQDVLDDSRQSLLAQRASERGLEVPGDLADVDLDVARELGDLVEADGRVALEGRARRDGRRAHGARDQLDVFVAEHPEALDRGRGAVAELDVPRQLDVHQSLSAHEPDLGDLADEDSGHANVRVLLESGDVVELNRHGLAEHAADFQVLDLPDQESGQDEDDQEKRSDFCCSAHRAPQMTRGARPSSDSTVSGPSARPSTNWRTGGSLDFKNSSGGPWNRICPPKRSASRSPILDAL